MLLLGDGFGSSLSYALIVPQQREASFDPWRFAPHLRGKEGKRLLGRPGTAQIEAAEKVNRIDFYRDFAKRVEGIRKELRHLVAGS